jgi:hypothetical protein
MTAVEWLLNEISSTTILDKEDIKLFKQAKEIEKQQIIDACNAGLSGIPRSSKQYYNETFKNK